MVWLLSPAHKQWRVLGFSLGLPHLVRHATSAGKRRPSLCFSILSECRFWENRWSRASVQIHVYYAGERGREDVLYAFSSYRTVKENSEQWAKFNCSNNSSPLSSSCTMSVGLQSQLGSPSPFVSILPSHLCRLPILCVAFLFCSFPPLLQISQS